MPHVQAFVNLALTRPRPHESAGAYRLPTRLQATQEKEKKFDDAKDDEKGDDDAKPASNEVVSGRGVNVEVLAWMLPRCSSQSCVSLTWELMRSALKMRTYVTKSSVCSLRRILTSPWHVPWRHAPSKPTTLHTTCMASRYHPTDMSLIKEGAPGHSRDAPCT